jgi:hypothetical protein
MSFAGLVPAAEDKNRAQLMQTATGSTAQEGRAEDEPGR